MFNSVPETDISKAFRLSIPVKLVDTPEKKGLDLKSRSELEISYMKMEERDRLLEEKGKRIGRIEGEKAGRIQGERNRLISQVQKKLAKNQSPAEIADALEEDENVILALIEEIQADQ